MGDAKPEKTRKRPRVSGRAKIAITCIALVVVCVPLALGLAWLGILMPPGAAAQYNGFNYISEADVTSYIESYKIQQCGENPTDEEWAEYLESADMTAEELREATIQQLVTEVAVADVAAANGIEVTDEEVDESMDALSESLALGDDAVLEDTAAEHGVTLDELSDNVEFSLLEDAVFEALVEEEEATDDETLYYLETYYADGTETKHVYLFTMSVDEDEADYDVQYAAIQARDELLEMGATVENFEAIVEKYCDDDELVARGGSNGYDIDMGDMSETYQSFVDDTDVGEVSEVYPDYDEELYGFVFVDDVFEIPAFDEDDPYALSDFPEVLQEYFRTCMTSLIWEDDCNTFLLELYEATDCTIRPMPSGLSYDVEM